MLYETSSLDQAAAVFLEMRPRLFGIAYRMLPSAAEAEDVVQETWLRWQSAERSAIANPAAFLTLIIGALITALAIWLELAAHPPFWVHIILWVPLTALAVTYGLRVSKAWLLQAEYWRRAGEAAGDRRRL